MDRLFGLLIVSMALSALAVVTAILSEGMGVLSFICIGIVFLIGVLLLFNDNSDEEKESGA
ncbi:hypothetical protein LCM10_12505 [Rossellomorea aquimaris]|uniref:hypothetical protein n=1 Tax=Rossellomorea aquimaris TaxID=189382 RepID=UPI001CD6694F|nr:hypothetical protein [Rossellomorea aquimaris]MCA1055810.1 hypothetical protein [Rossellomorea aquimaris]